MRDIPAEFRRVESAMEIPLDHVHRILILGCPGSGKTTVARALARRSGLPRRSMDDLYWEAGWRRPSRSAFEARLHAALAAPAWVLDGNYADSIERRLVRADTIVWMDVPSAICLARVIRRAVGRALGDATSLPEAIARDPAYRPGLRVDPRFLAYVATFDRRVRSGLLERIPDFDAPGGRYLLRPRWRGDLDNDDAVA